MGKVGSFNIATGPLQNDSAHNNMLLQNVALVDFSIPFICVKYKKKIKNREKMQVVECAFIWVDPDGCELKRKLKSDKLFIKPSDECAHGNKTTVAPF